MPTNLNNPDSQWIKYRKLLLLELANSTDSIQEIYNSLLVVLNGKIQLLDINSTATITDLIKTINEQNDKAASLRTEHIHDLVDVASDLSEKASLATDISNFGSQLPEAISTAKLSIGQLGGGSIEAAEILKKRRYNSGFSLSDSVWRSDKALKRKTKNIISSGIREGKILIKTAKAITKIKAVEAPEKIPEFLREFERQARRAAQGMPGALREYRKLSRSIKKELLKRAQREFDRPVKRGLSFLGTRRAQETFLFRVEKAVQDNSKDMVGEAVNELLINRAQYNSVRATRTMTNNAFIETGRLESLKKPWIVGRKWNLSASHPRPDECDLRAGVNLGMGEGVYPKEAQLYDHPNGLCFFTDVLDDKYFEREEGEESEINYVKGWRKQVEEVKFGGKRAREANLAGRKVNRGSVASEIRKNKILPKDASRAIKSPEDRAVERAQQRRDINRGLRENSGSLLPDKPLVQKSKFDFIGMDRSEFNGLLGIDRDEFFKELTKGLPGKYKIDTRMRDISGKNYISFSSFSENFSFRRDFDIETGIMKHSFFNVRNVGEVKQGTGIGKQFIRNSIGLYQRMGVKRIVLNANLEVGGYAWAKYGFIPTKNAWEKRIKPWVRMRMREIDLTPRQRVKLNRILGSDDPKSIWKIADMRQRKRVKVEGDSGDGGGMSGKGKGKGSGGKVKGKGKVKSETKTIGQLLLLESDWSGEIDFSDRRAMRRLLKYVGL